jgi:hypothetical protein
VDSYILYYYCSNLLLEHVSLVDYYLYKLLLGFSLGFVLVCAPVIRLFRENEVDVLLGVCDGALHFH